MSPSTTWSETIPAGEAELFEGFAKDLRQIQEQRAAKHPMGRGLHYKAHGGLRASLDVLDGLPDWAKVGIFAAPGTYRSYVRFSNGAGQFQRDKVEDVRGFALKVVGVPGEKLIPGMTDCKTQDFLAILTPSLPFRSTQEFVTIAKLSALPPWQAPFALIFGIGLRRLPSLLGGLKAFVGVPTPSVASATFYTPAPIRWGDYAVKYSFVSKNPAGGPDADAKNPLRVELAERLRKGPLTWEMRVQAYVDPVATPIEDSTVAWDESKSPWITVARLTVYQQDIDSAEGVALGEYVEKLSFDPWHAPVEFRPLGEAMRARSAAYRESTIARGAAPEPDGSEPWPA